MRIEGIAQSDRHDNRSREFFVRMTYDELAYITGRDWLGVENLQTGHDVDISKRSKRILDVENALSKLKPQIDNLRSLAALIESQIPPVIDAMNSGIEQPKGGES